MPFRTIIDHCVAGFKTPVIKGTAIIIALAAVLLALAPDRAHAHSFHVFALGDGDIIEGYAYFGGGARPHHADLSIEGSDGKVLLTGQTNDNGEFRLRVDHLDDYTIRANTGDGHAASYIVKSSELADDLPKATATSPASVVALNATEDAPNTDIDLSPNASPAPTGNMIAPENQRISITAEQLSTLVSHAVAKQVNPLREQIVAYENKVRFSDIIGGLGIIIGIFGAIAWWQARKRVSTPPE
ncbi:hypothetical protein TH25_09105 [Thalassospira profundimaris]|uniref:Cobalt ABC transporter permease n=1 Tax=Thalassospira profundimaris TaxID=502049 RepID=A0A367XBT8_9PROT|nr:hypothetical protein [Thalassospira profundimaris]RCK51133.1 hypothetical protein TH25_09105 [Thalassospira profundimaris]